MNVELVDLIIIFIIAFLAATISGAAGFGGALLLLPILTIVVGVKAAIPILTIGQLFGNASRVWFGRKELKWKPILFFLLSALPLTIFGSYMFTEIDGKYIKIGIGVFLILLVIYRRTSTKKISFSNKTMIIGGALTGFLSGIAGSAGPLGAAFFLGLNLSSLAYIASEAFTALAMHLTKSFVYGKYNLIGLKELLLGLFIGISMIIGSWTGKNIIEKMSRKNFLLLVEVLLFVSGLQMILSELNIF